jgi:signal transduction histidine kinase
MVTLVLAAAQPHKMAGGQAFDLAVAVLACLPIILLRRWPLPLFAVAALVGGVETALGAASLPLGGVVGLAMYFVAVRLRWGTSACAVVAALVALCGGLLYAALATERGLVGPDVLDGAVPLIAAWFIGVSVATRRRYLTGLARQEERERAAELERARQEVREERIRIARDLHDIVAHSLGVMTVQAGVGRRLLAKRPEAIEGTLESIEMVGRTAQDELRVVLGLLRDGEPETASLAPAPRLADLKELAETVRAAGTPVELRTSGVERTLSPALELSIYRVVQEALTNVVKHAPGARSTVLVELSADSVRVEVTDDGRSAVSFPGADSPGGRHGIIGMRERLVAFGGSLTTEFLPGGGFRVLGRVPLEGAP